METLTNYTTQDLQKTYEELMQLYSTYEGEDQDQANIFKEQALSISALYKNLFGEEMQRQ